MNKYMHIILVGAVLFPLFVSCRTKLNVVKREISNPEILYLLDRMDEIDKPDSGIRLDRYHRLIIEQRSMVRWSIFSRFQELILQQDPVMLLLVHDITTAEYDGSLWTPELTYDFRVIRLYTDSLIISDGKPSIIQHEVKAILESDHDAIEEMRNMVRNSFGGSSLSVFYIKRKEGAYHVELIEF